jgi:hypothetical protein
VVLAKEDNAGNKRLVAYVVADGLLNKQELTTYLYGRLPEYMVPAHWAKVERFDLTSNGKIDRKALPDPDTNSLLANEYVEPTNELETKLATIWQDLLGIDKIGIHDNFFELGGHSLLAMRVISSIRRELKLDTAIKEIFVHPTIALLATHLQTIGVGLSLPSIEVANPRPKQIPLSFSQERLWFIDRLEGSVQYHVPEVLRLKGELKKDVLENALKGIVNRHEILRTVIGETEGQAWQQIRDEDQWQLNFIDGSKYTEDPKGLRQYIHQLINQPFDLSKDDMLRAALIELNEHEHLLVVTMHHIASDAWSTSVIVKELVELYSASDEGRSVNLAPLEIQYADYAIWQRTNLQGAFLEKKLDYWKQKLQGVSPLQLPVDYTRPAVQTNNGAIASFLLDREVAAQLQLLSQQQETTLFMTLLAAFNVLLSRYSAQRDICVGSTIANRTQAEVEKIIGFFVNTLALRSEVNKDISFTEFFAAGKRNNP